MDTTAQNKTCAPVRLDGMRILVATDAWRPQVNGVVRTYERVAAEARGMGMRVEFLSPLDFTTVRFPLYPEIRLALPNMRKAAHVIDAFKPDYIHIATEGPVGLMARRYCMTRGRSFTTSYHTRFPEYMAALFSIPASWSYWPVRRFHASGIGMMVATRSLSAELIRRGFRNLIPWTRGVDTELFRPRNDRIFGETPVFLYVGRVSREKNIEAFLDLDLPGLKVVVGDGPCRERLTRRYPDTLFTGQKTGEDLAVAFASADVFVFPSRTDTFGLVLLEALASGLPVAAFPVTGPIDIVRPGVTGFLSDDLAAASRAALAIGPDAPRSDALQFSWANTARLFVEGIEKAHARSSTPAVLQRAKRRRRARLVRRLAAATGAFYRR